MISKLINIKDDANSTHTIINIFGMKLKFAKKVIPTVKLKENGKKNILLISHELSHTGAPMMLLEIAKMLKDEYNIFVWSPSGGNLCEYFSNIGIQPSILGKIIRKKENIYASLMKKFDLVIVNTVVNDFFAQICSKYQIPFIWYIHEAKLAQTILPNQDLLKEELKNAEGHILTVSEYAQKFFQTEYNVQTEIIKNFAEDKYTANEFKIDDKIKFLYIGSIYPPKGVEYLCQAFVELEEKYKDKIELDIIGDFSDREYKERVEKICANTKIINFKGSYPMEKCIEEYKKSNVIIVPSVDESSSKVVLEACMQSRPVVVTENVGAKYMVTPETGWIVKTASVDDIKRCVIEILNNPEKLKDMGMKARKLYLKTATIDIYKHNLFNIIKRYL